MQGSRSSLLLESAQRLLRRGAPARVRHLLGRTRSEDIALLFPRLLARERRQIYDLLGDDDARAAVLTEMDPALIPELLDPMPVARVVEVLRHVSPDDLADIMAEFTEERTRAILDAMKESESLEVEGLMAYPPETAGGIMSPEFFALLRATTVREAVTALQDRGESLEMAFYVYVINEQGQLFGVVSLRQLVTTRPDVRLDAIAETEVVSVPLDADQEEVAQLVARYNFLAVPVVDDTNRLLGIVTVDDIIDVLAEEATEDMFKLAGAGRELPATASTLAHLRVRYPWLLASCVSGFVAAVVMNPFLDALASLPFLALFIPIVTGISGNVGIQSSTVIVRGLAVGQIDVGHFRGIVRRELGVGVLMGLGYGILIGGAAATYSWLTGTSVGFAMIAYFALTLCLAILATMLLAATVGTLVPMALHRLNQDPAVATGPFVTGTIDILGIVTYFSLAITLGRLFGL